MFLLPVSNSMFTARISNDSIELLQATPFPSGQRYALSEHGLAACVDRDKNEIHYGFIQSNGELTGYHCIPFPNMIHPDCVVIKGEYLVFGGSYAALIDSETDDSEFGNLEIIATYSIVEKEFKPVHMPHKEWGKSIDDLLVDGHKIIAVDNIVMPKYMIDYDFTDPANPKLIEDHQFYPGPNDNIIKGTSNDEFVVLLSNSWVMTGLYQTLSVFYKGKYTFRIELSEKIKLEQGPDEFDLWNDDGSIARKWDEKQKEFRPPSIWRDVVLIPNSNVVLLACGKDGVGMYWINREYLENHVELNDENEEEENESFEIGTNEIAMFPYPEGELQKILLVPEESKKIVLIFAERDTKGKIIPNYTYRVEDVSKFI